MGFLLATKPDIAGLYTLCDNTPCPDTPHETLALQLLSGGAKIVQLRMKDTRRCRVVAENIMKLKKKFLFTFIINDDVQLARDVSADGVHVGADDLPVDACRRFLGPSKYIGYSAHSLEEAEGAEERGADYVAFGAIFESSTKGVEHPVQGLMELQRVVRSVDIPVVAIGGIDQSNVIDVLDAGAAAVAMIAALTGAPDVLFSTRQMMDIIK